MYAYREQCTGVNAFGTVRQEALARCCLPRAAAVPTAAARHIVEEWVKLVLGGVAVTPCSCGLSATSQQYFSEQISHQSTVLLSHNKSAPVISHQPNEQAGPVVVAWKIHFPMS
jgi:hypothetical protein